MVILEIMKFSKLTRGPVSEDPHQLLLFLDIHRGELSDFPIAPADLGDKYVIEFWRKLAHCRKAVRFPCLGVVLWHHKHVPVKNTQSLCIISNGKI